MRRRRSSGATALLAVWLIARVIAGGEPPSAGDRGEPEVVRAAPAHRTVVGVARVGEPSRARRSSALVGPADVPAPIAQLAPDRLLVMVAPLVPPRPIGHVPLAPTRARSPPRG